MRFCLLSASLAVVCASWGDYSARLYFKNETLGTSNQGPVYASAGDVVSVNFKFHGGQAGTNRWSALQAVLDVYANPTIAPSVANLWKTWVAYGFPLPPHRNRYSWQPSDGLLRDNARNPADPQSVIVTPQGLHLLVYTDTTKPGSRDIEVKLFQFVAAGAGALNWKYDGRNTSTGLSTRLIDAANKTVDITDNWLVVTSSILVDVSARLELDRLSPGAALPSSVLLRLTAEGEAPTYQNVLLDSGGVFTVSVPKGKYTLSAQHSHWLRRTISVDATVPLGAPAPMFLLNGDPDKDAIVGLLDLNLVVTGFLSPPTGEADLDMDGEVGLSDLTIILTNFLMHGDP